MSRGDRSQSARERTAAERERDRQERERRRAQRSGEALSGKHPAEAVEDAPAVAPSPAVASEGPSASAAAPEEPPVLAAPLERPPAPTPALEQPAAPMPAPERPAPTPALERPPAPMPAPERPPAAAVDPRDSLVPTAGIPADSTPSIEPPPRAPTMDSPGPSPESPQPPTQPPTQAPAAIRRRSRFRPSQRKARSPIARLGAVLALAVVIAAVVLLFRSLLRSSHTKTITPAPVVKVVIPEGKTRAQIAQIAVAKKLSGSYRSASRRSRLLDPARYGAPRGTPDLEGFLFPATYDMNPGESVNRLVEDQLLAFRENFGTSDLERARALHVTPYQLLIVASMVEREAQVPGDRPKIAAVIYNRLRQGMPLGIDATIYYAVELRTGIATYTRELTQAQLQIDSPYNTRTHTGLPPTPISNPGLASIHAAADPDRVGYIYYVAGADGCGEQVFSTTLAGFEVDATAYREAVKRNGGRPPTCKKR